MGAAPLSWLAKIGGDTLKTKAKLLSSAINELYDDGQCKIVAVVDNTADNGKTVLITTDDNKTYSGTIANKKCEFLLPPKTLYTVQKVSSGSVEFTTKVEAGYGDYILVHLDTGYVEVKQGDIVGLDYIKAATDDNLKNKVQEAKAVKELNSSLMKHTLIWTNPDISASAFAAQTINIDLSDYDAIYIDMLSTDSVQRAVPNQIIGKGGTVYITCSSHGSNGVPWITTRSVQVSDNSIVFSDCTQQQTNGSNYTTVNYRIVPHKIYGIKF